jgi:radical SAM protein with 4Fe4S-binding SPASM domain
MTFADIIILIMTVGIVFLIVYKMVKNRKSPCESCAYLKHCHTGCEIPKKEKSH